MTNNFIHSIIDQSIKLTRRCHGLFEFAWRKLIASLVLASITLSLVPQSVFAAPIAENSVGPKASLDPVDNKTERLKSQGASNVDPSTGALQYSYPIVLPPGRGGMTPKLNLSYNSQNNHSSWFGYAWNIDIPYIERINKNGSEQIYTKPVFASSLHGELISTDGVNFEMKSDDGSYPKYTFTDGAWKLIDRDGNTYFFGNSDATREQNDTGIRIGRWYLASMVDKFGNGISYSYTKDNGTLYPLAISYTEHPAAKAMNHIDFLLEDKADMESRYNYGFAQRVKKRISAINIFTNGTASTYINLTYATGTNGYRTLLSSIEEKRLGSDGSWVTQPKTTFAYEKSAMKFSGTITVSNAPYSGVGLQPGNGETIVVGDINADGILAPEIAPDAYYPIDINGDFRKDFMRSDLHSRYANQSAAGYRFNTPTGYSWVKLLESGVSAQSFPVPPALRTDFNDGKGFVQSSAIGDVNGDGLDDIMGASSGVVLNTGNNSFAANAKTNFNFGVEDHLADVNGDGFPDRIAVNRDASTAIYTVYLNSGSSFDTTQYFSFDAHAPRMSSGLYDDGVRLLDINNDGLPEIIHSYQKTIGSCAGWAPSGYPSGDYNEVYLNTGTGFVLSSLKVPGYIVSYGPCADPNVYHGTKEYDINGDLTVDYDGAVNQTVRQDILKHVGTSLGGNIDIEYQWSTHDGGSANPVLPIPQYVVKRVTESSANNDSPSHITDYDFRNGKMYFDANTPRDRRFAGFGKVDINEGPRRTTLYMHQGDGDDTATGEKGDNYFNIGRIYRKDVFDTNVATPKLLTSSYSLYKTYAIASTTFSYLASETTNDYNSDGSWVSKGTSYEYDTPTRTLSRVRNYGDILPFTNFATNDIVDRGVDLVTTQYEYTSARPERVYRKTVTDSTGNSLGRETTYFDLLPLAEVNQGVPTKNISEIYKSDGALATTSQTTMKYDTTGNIISQTDNIGRTSSVVYDQNFLYPISQTNAAGGVSMFSYDPISGQALSKKGPDGIFHKAEYDGFGRATRVYDVGTAGGMANEVKTQYSYDNSGVTIYSERTVRPGVVWRSMKHYDALGRLLQEKNDGGSGAFSTINYRYDANGNIIARSWPYETVGFGYTHDNPQNGEVKYLTDVLGRVTRQDTGGDYIDYTYNGRGVTVQDYTTLNQKKSYNFDARGNVISVGEYNTGALYSTAYAYSPLGKLSRITDANGNVRSFDYASDGMLLLQEDLHGPNDLTFSTYKYDYDAARRLSNQVNPLGTVSYLYDVLDRPISRSAFHGGTGITSIASTTYGTCVNTYSAPCVISTQGTTKQFAYDEFGRKASETVAIDGNSYTKSYSYDGQGNIAAITYPNGGILRYSYASNGKQMSSVYTTPDGKDKQIVSDTQFNSLNLPERVVYGNGMMACNAYTGLWRGSASAPRLVESLYSLGKSRCDLADSGEVALYREQLGYSDPTILNSTTETYREIAGGQHVYRNSFTYDNLMRITSVQATLDLGATTTRSLAYDPLGNITQDNGVNYLYSSDGIQNPDAATMIGDIRATYDAQGNRITLGSDVFGWDVLNRMTSATTSKTVEQYGYDENGERIKRFVAPKSLSQLEVGASSSLYSRYGVDNSQLFSATTSTTTTYISKSSYDLLLSISLLDRAKLTGLVRAYYGSPFIAQYCVGASDQTSCAASTTKQLFAQDLQKRIGTSTLTIGLVTDSLGVVSGAESLPGNVNIYSSTSTAYSVATYSTVVFTPNTQLTDAYGAYLANGTVIPLVRYSGLPLISQTAYQDLVTADFVDSLKIKQLFTYSGCALTSNPCGDAEKIVFEYLYKQKLVTVSDSVLSSMWLVYSGQARIPSGVNEYASSSIVQAPLVPITGLSTTTKVGAYNSGLYFASQYNSQAINDPRLLYLDNIPLFVTKRTYLEFKNAGIDTIALQNYAVAIRDVIGIPVTSKVEFIVALSEMIKADKSVTLSDQAVREAYLVLLGAGKLPGGESEYIANGIYDLTDKTALATYTYPSGGPFFPSSGGCNPSRTNVYYNYSSRCQITVTPFVIPGVNLSSAKYVLAVFGLPSPIEPRLHVGLANIVAPMNQMVYTTEYPYGITSDNARMDVDLTSFVSPILVASSSNSVVLSTMEEAVSYRTPYSPSKITLTAYTQTPAVTMSVIDTGLLFGTSTISDASTTPDGMLAQYNSSIGGIRYSQIQGSVNTYISQGKEASVFVSSATTTASTTVVAVPFMSDASFKEFASTTLNGIYGISRLFDAIDVSTCAGGASTTECEKNLREVGFQNAVGYLTGFVPSRAAVEEFWMLSKGTLRLPLQAGLASSTLDQVIATSSMTSATYPQGYNNIDGTGLVSSATSTCTVDMSWNYYYSINGYSKKCFVALPITSTMLQGGLTSMKVVIPADSVSTVNFDPYYTTLHFVLISQRSYTPAGGGVLPQSVEVAAFSGHTVGDYVVDLTPYISRISSGEFDIPTLAIYFSNDTTNNSNANALLWRGLPHLSALFGNSTFDRSTINLSVSTATSTIDLAKVPAGLLSDTQFRAVYSTSSLATYASTTVVSNETYNELLSTPIRTEYDVNTLYDYVLSQVSTSTCAIATSTTCKTAQQDSVRATIGKISGVLLSESAMEELYRVRSGALALIPQNLDTATLSRITQGLSIPLDSSKIFITSSSTGAITGKCAVDDSLGQSCRIVLPLFGGAISRLTAAINYLSSTTPSTVMALVTEPFLGSEYDEIKSLASSTLAFYVVSGNVSTSSTIYDLTSAYNQYASRYPAQIIIQPQAASGATSTLVSSITLNIERSVNIPQVTYDASTKAMAFNRSSLGLSVSTSTTSIDLVGAPNLNLSLQLASPLVPVTATSSSANITAPSMAYEPISQASLFGSSVGVYTTTLFDEPFNGSSIDTSKWMYPYNGGAAYGTVSGGIRSVTGNQTNNGAIRAVNSITYDGTPLNWAWSDSPAPTPASGWGDGVYSVGADGNPDGKYTGNIQGSWIVTLGGGQGQRIIGVLGANGVFQGANQASYGYTLNGYDTGVNSVQGTYHTVKVSIDASGIMRLYFDGVLMATGASAVPLGTKFKWEGGAIYDNGNIHRLDSVAITSDTPMQSVTGYIPAATSTARQYPYIAASAASTTLIHVNTSATSSAYSVYTPFEDYVVDTRGTITTYFSHNGKLAGSYTQQTNIVTGTSTSTPPTSTSTATTTPPSGGGSSGVTQPTAGDSGAVTAGAISGSTSCSGFTTSNLAMNDSVIATCTAGVSGRLGAFPLSIPAGATIYGVKVMVVTGAGTQNIAASLSSDGGSTFTASKSSGSVSLSAGAAPSFGGETDTWGRTWSPSDFAVDKFQVNIGSGMTYPAYLDSVKVQVYYTTPVPVNVPASITAPGDSFTAGLIPKPTSCVNFTASNLATNDSVVVTCGAGVTGRLSAFPLNIPSGATIYGVKVTAVTGAGTQNIAASLSSDGGATFTASKSTGNVSYATGTAPVFGSETDTWGRAWSSSDFNADKFQVNIGSGMTYPAYLDSVKVQVYYTTQVPVNIPTTITAPGDSFTAGLIPKSTSCVNFTTSNLATNDSVIATCSAGISGRLSAFPLNIPAGATISGVKVTAVTGAGTQNITVSLSSDAGTTFTASKGTGNVSYATGTTPVFGSETDLWGRTWTPADFAVDKFQVNIGSAMSYPAYLDSVKVQVYYTTQVPVSVPTTVTNSGDSFTAGLIPKSTSCTGFTTAKLAITDSVVAVCPAGISGRLSAFPLNIPASSTISGVKVTMVTGNGTQNIAASLSSDAGTTFTASKGTGNVSYATGTTPVFGSETDLWGRTWTPADFAVDKFQVNIGSAMSYPAILDSVKVQVFFTPVGSANTTSGTVYLSSAYLTSAPGTTAGGTVYMSSAYLISGVTYNSSYDSSYFTGGSGGGTSTSTPPISTTTPPIITSAASSTFNYFITNHLGTPIFATDENGDIVEAFLTDTFGNLIYRSARNDAPYLNKGYTGHTYDTETALTYAHARYLDTQSHTFMSADPASFMIGDNDGLQDLVGRSQQELLMDPQQLNSYSYARNNPATMRDPDGRLVGVDDLAGATVGAITGVAVYTVANLATDQDFTAGGFAGAAVSGGVVGIGVANSWWNGGGSAVLGAATAGAVGGAVNNGVQQVVDRLSGNLDEMSLSEFAISTVSGAVLGGAAEKFLPVVRINGLTKGRANWEANGRGLQTQLRNGSIKAMSAMSAFKSSAGAQIKDSVKNLTSSTIDSSRSKNQSKAINYVKGKTGKGK